MPVITNAGGGGGATSDECTLIRANVPTGLKAVMADSDDEALEGTLDAESNVSDSQVLEKQTYFKYNFSTKRWEKRTGTRKNNGTLNKALNCGESFDIPAGDTTGGKVTANSLASQTPGTATSADMMAGTTATVNGVRITGVKVNYGTINATLNCGQSRTLPAGSINGGAITAASLASQTGGVTAEDGYVYNGKTYWKDGVKRTGNMAVNSLLSFSAAAYGGKQILLKWQNPYAATGKPFSGVVITRSTGGYPGTGGEWIYQGAGNNTAPGGWSQVVLTMPALSTGYYFSIFPYVTCSAGTMYGGVINAYAATAAELWLTFTSSQSYVIPAGYSKMDSFAVGGGGGSFNQASMDASSGGGGGYTNTSMGISVSSGDTISVVVGAGGTPNSNGTNRDGSASIVNKNGVEIITAKGGSGSTNTIYGSGGSGGGIHSNSDSKIWAGRGGSDGSNGLAGNTASDVGSPSYLAKGQGTTTRAWGTGTLYAGGGGGGSRWTSSNKAGAGGAGGGGNGSSAYQNPGGNGAANTGGGAGGCNYGGNLVSNGGSGIVLLHIY